MLAPVLDPLHRHAGFIGRQRRSGPCTDRCCDLIPKLPPMSVGTMKRSRFSGSCSTRATSGCMMNGPMKLDQIVSTPSSGVPARDHAVGLDRRGAVLRELEALADDHVGLGEGPVGIAVDEPAVARQVRADLLVQDRRVRLERPLRDRRPRAAARSRRRPPRRRPRPGSGRGATTTATGSPTKRTLSVAARVVVHGRGHADAEGLARLGHVGAGDRRRRRPPSRAPRERS